jgi:HAMP domain-containing protein
MGPVVTDARRFMVVLEFSFSATFWLSEAERRLLRSRAKVAALEGADRVMAKPCKYALCQLIDIQIKKFFAS